MRRAEGGGGSWQSGTFFGFQLLKHPCLLALFAVGLRLHVLSQIPWKEMRMDSGSWPQGRGTAKAGGSLMQCPAGKAVASKIRQGPAGYRGWAGGPGHPCAWVLRLGCVPQP